MSERVCTCNSSTKDWGIHDWDCALEFVRKFPRDASSEYASEVHNTAISISHHISSYAWLDGLTDEDYQLIRRAVDIFTKYQRAKAD